MDTVRTYLQKWYDVPQPRKVQLLKLVAAGCYAFFLLLFVIYAFGGTRHVRRDPTSLVLFVDPVPDAFLSIRYLALRKDIVIEMIVVSASSWSQDAFQSLGGFIGFVNTLQNEGLARDIPIYYGHSMATADSSFPAEINYDGKHSVSSGVTSCTYSRIFSPQQHFDAERFYGVGGALLHNISVFANFSADDYYEAPLKALLDKKSDVRFVVLGVATDVASFLQRFPGQQSRVKSITLAGGAFAVSGNVRYIYAYNKMAELNFFLDPLAANYITTGAHGIPVTVVPLDATFAWNSTAYATLVSDVSGQFPSMSTNSSVLIASGVNRFHHSFPQLSQNISSAVLTSVYVAEATVQASAEVSIFPVAVTSTSALTSAGQSVYYPTLVNTSTVVLRVNPTIFWSNLLRVYQFTF